VADLRHGAEKRRWIGLNSLLNNIADHSTTGAQCAHSQPLCNRLSFDNRVLERWETIAALFPRYSPKLTADIEHCHAALD
jgi:hypothetical protein